MTDAEILRTLAGEGSCDPYLGYIAPMYAFDVQRKKDTDFDAARKVDAVAKALFDRAADAIEENARLRAALVALTTNPYLNLGDLVYTVREREELGWEGPAVKAWSDAVQAADAALRKPDAAE